MTLDNTTSFYDSLSCNELLFDFGLMTGHARESLIVVINKMSK